MGKIKLICKNDGTDEIYNLGFVTGETIMECIFERAVSLGTAGSEMTFQEIFDEVIQVQSYYDVSHLSTAEINKLVDTHNDDYKKVISSDKFKILKELDPKLHCEFIGDVSEF